MAPRKTAEVRFRVGDRVDFNNTGDVVNKGPNGTPGTIRRVIITRKYVVAWDDGFDDEPYEAGELIALEEDA